MESVRLLGNLPILIIENYKNTIDLAKLNLIYVLALRNSITKR